MMSGDFPVQTEFRAGVSEVGSRWELESLRRAAPVALSLFLKINLIHWMRIPAFLWWDSSWSHVSFRNPSAKPQFFNYTAALK